MCMLQFPNPSWYWDTVTKICVFLFAFAGGSRVLVITVCYGLMLRPRSVRLLPGSKEKDRSLRRITRMVLVVVGASCVLGPHPHLRLIALTLVTSTAATRCGGRAAPVHALATSNSSLNPRALRLPRRELQALASASLCRMSCGREPSSPAAPAKPRLRDPGHRRTFVRDGPGRRRSRLTRAGRPPRASLGGTRRLGGVLVGRGP